MHKTRRNETQDSFPMYPLGGATIPAVDTAPPPIQPYFTTNAIISPGSTTSSMNYPCYALPMPMTQGPPPTTTTATMAYPMGYPMYTGVYATPYLQSINGTAIPYGVYVPQYQVQQQQQLPASFVLAQQRPPPPAPSSSTPSAPARSLLDEINNESNTQADDVSEISKELGSLDLMTDASLRTETKERCRHCGFYFNPDTNKPDSCTYHPGSFVTPDTVTPIMMPIGNLQRWTCCKGSEKSSSSGCRTGYHAIDTRTSQILKRFEASSSRRNTTSLTKKGGDLIDLTFDNNHVVKSTDAVDAADDKESGTASTLYPSLNRAQITGGKFIKTSEADSSKDSVRHVVALTDTLSGLGVRYGVKVEDIKRANNLLGDSIFERKYLDIPNPTRLPSDEELAARPMPKNGKDMIGAFEYIKINTVVLSFF